MQEYCHEVKERKDSSPLINAPLIPQEDDLFPAMEQYLSSRGLSYVLARVNKWHPVYLDVPRILVPCHTSDHRIYWQARDMGLKPEFNVKRWLSPSVARGDAIVKVFPHSFFQGYKNSGIGVVVEGPMDALAAAECGHIAFALMGASPPRDVLVYLSHNLRVYDLNVILIPDLDGMGTFLSQVPAHLSSAGFVVMIKSPYPYSDCAEIPLEARKEYLEWQI